MAYQDMSAAWVYKDLLKASKLNQIGENIELVQVPVGGIIAWHKTFGLKDSGTTDGTTASKLVDSTQNFTSTVAAGMIIKNTTDDTFTYIVSVDSDTTLSIAGDIFVSGKDYTIYATRALPDGYVECSGQTLSDAESIYNGLTIPDLNGDNRFLKGDSSSGTETAGAPATLGSQSIEYSSLQTSYVNLGTGRVFTEDSPTGTFANAWDGTIGGDGTPANFTIVWIMRIK